MSAKGFAADEEVGVYLNSLNTEPTSVIKMDKSGNLGQGQLRIPFGAVGNHSLIFYGEKSQAPAVLPFTMLSLYPAAEVDAYAIKADNTLSITAEGFGPKEGVRVYLNGTDTPPLSIGQTNDQGTLSAPARIMIPFALKGKQTIVMLGEKSQATAVVGFEVMPYTPTVEPSTYGGRPGTVITFYGTGFARNEIVRVRVGKTHDSPGKDVSCFGTDGEGAVNGSGAYTIPTSAQAGTMVFHFVGSKSDGQATAAVEVGAPPAGVKPGPEDKTPFACPLDQPPPSEAPSGEGG
jgi:hypothetical protein